MPTENLPPSPLPPNLAKYLPGGRLGPAGTSQDWGGGGGRGGSTRAEQNRTKLVFLVFPLRMLAHRRSFASTRPFSTKTQTLFI
jgi:hypothetical protein